MTESPATYAMPYDRRGELLGAEIGTMLDDRGNYYVLLEQTPITLPLAHALRATGVAPLERDGREFFWLPYDERIDRLIVALTDALIDVRRHRPGYGQAELDL